MEKRTETDWAIRNIELAGFFKKDGAYSGMIGDAVKRLLEVHQKEGHSGMSNGIAASVFKEVATGQALTFEYWDERFKEYNDFAEKEGHRGWTIENFENIVMKKPKQ